MRWFLSRQRSQGYVEFGITVAVIALVAMLGLDGIKGAVYAYFTGDPMNQALNPPIGSGGPPPPPPPRNSAMVIDCGNGPLDNYYGGNPNLCHATVWDPDPSHASWPPLGGRVRLTTPQGGSPGDGFVNTSLGNGKDMVPCPVMPGPPGPPAPPGVPTSVCYFQYIPDISGLMPSPTALNRHIIHGDYHPGGGVTGVVADIQAAGVPGVPVRRYTAVDFPACLSPIHKDQATTCSAQVIDEDIGPPFPLAAGQLHWVVVTGAGTFEPPGYCTLDASASCHINYTPTATGSQSIEAFFVPDPIADPYHQGGYGLFHGAYVFNVIP